MKNAYLGLGGLLLGACVATPEKELPNIVIIVADDLGWGDVGFHNSDIPTPNIDRLADEGIILNRFYVAPMCSPTRAGMMTGRYPDRYGLRHVVNRPWFDYGLDTAETTLPEVLAEAGYMHRGIVGKWHLGHSRLEYHPLQRGFTDFYGHLNGAIDYFDHTREGQLDWHEGYETSYDEGYSTDLITREAVEFIREKWGNNPFFLYVAYNAPHSPLQAQEEYLKLVGYDETQPPFQGGRGKGNTIRQTFSAMVANMDKGIGDILATIDEVGITENTLVLFFSDNGGARNLGASNGDLRGGKLTEWEGGVRVPAVIKWPGGFAGGRITDQVTGFVDVLPTLCDLLGLEGIPGRPVDGISILPVLRSETEEIDRNFYLGCGAIVNSDWKLIRKEAIRGLSRMRINEDMLFAIGTDPNEITNVRDQYPDVYRELLETLSVYDGIVPTMTPPPDIKPPDFVPPKEWKIEKN